MAWAVVPSWTGNDSHKSASSTWTPTLNISTSINDIIIVWFTCDNLSLTTPTISSLSVPAGETASWVKLADHPSSVSTGVAGCVGEVWGIKTATAWSAFSPLITLSGSVTAKAVDAKKFTGGTLTKRGAHVSSTSTSGTPSATLTGANQPQNGDLVLLHMSQESSTIPGVDTDTTNGSWVDAGGVASAGGSSTSNVALQAMYKIVTANGDQTGNTSSGSGDSGVSLVALQPAAAGSNFTSTPSDTATTSDSSTRAVGRKPSDTVTPSEDITKVAVFVRVPTDTATTTDAAGKAVTKPAADTATASDAAATALGRTATLGDTATPADATAKAAGKGLGDTATTSDAVAPISVSKRAPADTATPSDASVRGLVKRLPKAWADAVRAVAPYAWWRLNEPSGATAADSSGNGHNATYTSVGYGAASLVPSDPTDTAITVDANGDNVAASSLSFPSVGFTAFGIIKGTTASGSLFVTGGSNYLGLNLTNVYGVVNSVGVTLSPGFPAAALFTGAPVLVVWVVRATTAELWVNGQMVASGGHSQSSVTRTAFSLKTGVAGPLGDFDELGVVSSALSADQIYELYASWLGSEYVLPADASTRTTGKGTSDTATATDARAKAVTHPAADTATTSDATSRAPGPHPADTVTPTDSPSFTLGRVLSLSDTATPTDATAAAVGLHPADTATAGGSTDTAHGVHTDRADTATVTDATSTQPGLHLADTVTPSDSLTAVSGRGLADTATATDALAKVVGITLGDTVTAGGQTDTSHGSLLSLSDTVTPTDAATPTLIQFVNLADTATVSDALTTLVGRMLTDVAVATDVITTASDILRTASDAVSAVDALTTATGLSRGDAVTVLDTIAHALHITITDTATATDVATPQTSGDHIVNDVATVTDAITKRVTVTFTDIVGPAAGDWPTNDGLRQITNVVRNHETGALVAGATVKLIRDFDELWVATEVTAGDGSFTFTRDSADPYTYHTYVIATDGATQIHGVSDRGLLPEPV